MLMTPWDWDWNLTTTLAVLALAQPGVLLLFQWSYRRYLLKAEIVVHPTSTVQVGYGPYGASITLTGSLQAVNREQFVSGMRLTIANERTGERHQFGWHAFIAGHQRMTGGVPDSVLEVPAGFMVTTQQGNRYTVVFVGHDLEGEQVRPQGNRI